MAAGRTNDGAQERAVRTPPRNEEAERALLGALLLDDERVAEVADFLRSEDFYDRRHALIFEGILRLAERNTPVNFISLGETLRAAGTFAEVGGAQYVVQLAQEVTSSAHALHHAHIVADTAALRGLIREATEIITQAYETRPDGEAVKLVMDDSEQRIFQLARREQGKGAEPIAAAIKETFRRIEASTHRAGLTGLTSGFMDIDQVLCGLNAGDLIVLAARPSMGKTALALNIIEHAAMSQPEWLERKPVVLHFTLEMGRQSIVSRMLCTRARVEGHRLRRGMISSDTLHELASAADEFSRTSIFIDDTSSLSMMTLRGRARRQKARTGLDLIVVDYLQLLSFPKSESRQQEISDISRSLKALARELEVPVVALAQLSRQVEAREDKRPQLSDLRESGSIEQDADVVMLLFRPEYYVQLRNEDTRGLAEVIVAKQRNGPTGEVKLTYLEQYMRFENRAVVATEVLA
ncbi:MAG: replicative DNA helicase [Planctomycetes bacterium]|nr:replicative DNA helicase [Planctomycetota bacterium]